MNLVQRALPVHVVAGFDWPAWLTAIGTLILALGVLFAARQLREQRVERLTSAAANVSRRWDETDLIEARREIDKFSSDVELRDAVARGMQGEDGEINLSLLLREPDFFDDLGLQEILGGITLQWIEYSMGDIVTDRWKLWALTVEDLRKDDSGQPPVYGSFELLAKQLQGEGLGLWKGLRRRLGKWLIRTLPY